MTTSFGLRLAVAAGLILGAHTHAKADEAKERAVKEACMLGDPAKGMEILAELYLDTANPTYIYNQGRCLEQNSKFPDAIARFREFLIKAPTATAEEKQDVEKHIATCQAWLGRSPGEAVGAVGVAAGFLLILRSNSRSFSIQNDYSRSGKDSADAYKTWSQVSYATGTVCLLDGAFLYGLGHREGKQGTVMLGPSITQSVALLSASGGFSWFSSLHPKNRWQAFRSGHFSGSPCYSGAATPSTC